MTDPESPDVVKRRLAREHKARLEAESIAERVTGELYAAVEKLGHLNAELENANQSLREFVAIASHDLNNPLTAIVGFAGVLRDQAAESGDAELCERLDIILRNGDRMQRLVDDLLLLSRLEAGALQPRPDDVIVAEELERSIAECGEEGASIDVVADRGLLVHADRDHIQRIFGNYISNALKYGREPISTEASPNGPFVDVRVRDCGRGVADEFVERLFSKFSRAEDVKAAKPGTGLGLSIVRSLAEANGGDVWYEPNAPAGSCFGVRLPAAG